MTDAPDTTDPFLQLLTDALRAGPGSPEWHQAVAKLKTGGSGEIGANADEYQLLLSARQNLESGRSYREIRAGAGFTRKVLSGIENEKSPKVRSVPTTNIILGIAIFAVLFTIGFVFYIIHGSGNSTDDFANTYFATTAASATFDGPLSPQWKTIGSLPVDTSHGRLTAKPAQPSPNYIGGGIACTSPLPVDQPFAIEATLHFQHVTDDLIPQLFVSDTGDFSTDRPTTAHELVWLVRQGLARIVLPDGRIDDSTQKIVDGQTVTVRILVGPTSAQIVSGNKTQWAGLSQLNPSPRYVGVRFLSRGTATDAVTIESVKIMTR